MADSINETTMNDTQPWPNNESEYKLKELIGIGSIAYVYCAYCIPRREKCAIKLIDISKCNTPIESLLQDAQALSTYKHPNLVSHYANFIVKDILWLVMTFLEGGSLDETIKYKVSKSNCKRGVLDEVTIATVLKSTLRGLEYLNNKGQMHRDIKAGNILVGDNGMVKITDFGLSGLMCQRNGSKQDEREEFIGSAYWKAPEVMDPEETLYTKADIWSIGIAAIEMATGDPPYYRHSPMNVVKLTLLNDPPNLDTGADQKDQYKLYGKTFRNFIATCLNKEPHRRPTVGQLLQHPFLRKAKDRKLIIQTVISVGPSYATRVQKFRGCQRADIDSSTSTSSTQSLESLNKFFLRRAQRSKTPTISFLDKPDEKRKSTGVKNIWSTLFRKLNKFESSHALETWTRLEQKEASDLSVVASIPDMTRIAEQPVPLEKLSSTDIDEKSPSIPIVLRYRRSRGKLEDIKFLFSPDKDTPEGIAGELVQAGLLKPPDSVPVGKYLNRLIETGTMEPITFHLCNNITTNIINMDSEKDEKSKKLIPRGPLADPVEPRRSIMWPSYDSVGPSAGSSQGAQNVETPHAAPTVQRETPVTKELMATRQRPPTPTPTPVRHKNVLFKETQI